MNPGINIFLRQDIPEKDTLSNFKATIPLKHCKKYIKGEIVFTVWVDWELTVTNHHPRNPCYNLI